MLSESGYNTVHIGKWHMGDIMESWPNHQGFDFAAFPIHQQGQLTIFHDDDADEEVSIGIGKNNYDDRFTLDEWHRPDASAMVTGVEGERGEKVREVHMQPGERWTEAKYHEMNVRYQEQTMQYLRELAAKDEPFFLEYWPLYPLTGPRTTTKEYTTVNGVDVEPKAQVSGGEPWRNVDATPLVEFYPNSAMDLTAEVTVGRTRQNQEEKSWELTPRIGVRFHLFQRIWDKFHPERVPLSRLSFANLSRLEFRNLWYTGDRANSHETRFRNRTELKLALNHGRLSEDDTWYLFADVEFFVPLQDDVAERFATKRRLRSGFGYRLSQTWRFEALYIRDLARETLGSEGTIDMNAIDFRVKLLR